MDTYFYRHVALLGLRFFALKYFFYELLLCVKLTGKNDSDYTSACNPLNEYAADYPIL